MVDRKIAPDFKAIDNSGDSTVQSLQVIVNPAPVVTPPTCGINTTVNKILPFTTTVLTGTATAGTYPISTYLWGQTSGRATTISGGTTLAATISNITISGNYVYLFKATDDHGNFCTTSFTITAIDATCNCIITQTGKRRIKN